MSIKISVVIPNYNGIELLQKNLREVITSSSGTDTEFIIVDDASIDGSVNFVKKNFSSVRVIKHSKNKGFSGAVNTGIKASHGNLIVLLNTDVIPEKDYLTHALTHFKDRDVFAVSFHEKGYGSAKGKFENGFIVHEPMGETDLAKETFWVSGGSGIFRKEVLMELGMFDEKLLSPFYWEDVDIGYRAMKRGYKLIWEPNSHVLHKHESTISKISKSKRNLILQRNQLLFIWKNLTSKILFKKHVRGLIARIVKHPGYIKVFIAAIIKINKLKTLRNKEIKETTVSDETIFLKFNK